MEVGTIERTNDGQSEDETDDEGEALTSKEDQLAHELRDYHLELYNYALERNSVVCLNPGSGKTFISVLLIKELQHEILKPFDKGGKVTFFLVRKVALVAQQAQSIESHTTLEVGQYYGGCGVYVNESKCHVGDWNQGVWAKEFQQKQVFVATAQILLDLLRRNFITMDRINLIVMDECHRATGKDLYCRIMKFYQSAIISKPKILGFTAEVLHGRCKPVNIAANIAKLESTLDSRIVSNLEQVNKNSTKPKEVLLEYSSVDPSNRDLDFKIEDILVTCEKEIKESEVANGIHFKCLPEYLVKNVRSVYQILGIWPMREILKSFLDGLPNFEVSAPSSDELADHKIFSKIKEHFTKLRDLVTSVFDAMGDGQAILAFVTPKVKRLLDLLKAVTTSRFRGIVFVEEGSIAWMLDRYLRQLKQLHLQDYDQVASCYVVGHDLKSAYPWRADINVDDRAKSLLLFKNGQRNLLVGTFVVDQGLLDIPECNVVIRFDFPKTFCSYVHSKGKARAQKALFILMHSEADKENVSNTLAYYRVLEEELIKISIKNKQRQVEES